MSTAAIHATSQSSLEFRLTKLLPALSIAINIGHLRDEECYLKTSNWKVCSLLKLRAKFLCVLDFPENE